ncbi:B-4DMT family transporter [Saccharomonospora sp. NPDC046836]|uniref:B-4DMT family transporter n=1 Tax=Saccharomonospora sp. NPDC046836 TaxID=3156921 RepID=UPI0033ECAD2A
MPPWVARGLGMAVLHAAATVALAKIAVYQPTESTLRTAVVLALLVGAAVLWGAVDGWRRLPDASRGWFVGALVAGPLSGVLAVLGRAAFVDQTGISELGVALTGGAAFTALLILVPAGLGLLVGGRLAQPAQAGDGATTEPGKPSPRPRRPKVGPTG